VLLRAQRERVAVDTSRRAAAVVLVRLYLVEVRTLTLREAVLAVELELRNLHRVLAIASYISIYEELGEEVVRVSASGVRGCRGIRRAVVRERAE